MAAIQDLLVGFDENVATATGTAAATATEATPGADKRLFITGFSISHTTAPTVGGTVEIRSGSTVKKRYSLPGTAIAPMIYEFKRPIRCAENEAAVLDVAGWTTAVMRIELYTITRPA